MKEIKELIEQEDAEILDERFLEETLYPIAAANQAKRKRKFASIAAALSTCIVAAFAIGFGIIYRKDYTENYKKKESNILYLNKNLTSTQLIGDFTTVNLMYETHRETPVYFFVYREETGESWTQSISMKVVVKRDYEIDKVEYLKEIKFLEYTVYYNETNNIDDSFEAIVFEYKADAFIDTGAERYMIEYSEARTGDNDHFAEYLQKTIKQK
jgi:hypothetical protein